MLDTVHYTDVAGQELRKYFAAFAKIIKIIQFGNCLFFHEYNYFSSFKAGNSGFKTMNNRN